MGNQSHHRGHKPNYEMSLRNAWHLSEVVNADFELVAELDGHITRGNNALKRNDQNAADNAFCTALKRIGFPDNWRKIEPALAFQSPEFKPALKDHALQALSGLLTSAQRRAAAGDKNGRGVDVIETYLLAIKTL